MATSSPRHVNRKRDGEVMIALLGVTGAGKSTFASIASGKQLEIGHGVKPYPLSVKFELDGRTVILIDTPGFDDDQRSDVQILEAIFKWMTRKGLLKNQLLDGLIFLHPVTLNRVGGAEQRRTRLFEKILGPKAYKRVIIATTMWDDLKYEEVVRSRLNGRSGEGGVWHELCSKGAVMRRHDNNIESAHKIIREVIATSDRYGKVKSLLESELARNQGRVGKTSAGKELKARLKEDIRLLRSQYDDLLRDPPPEPPRTHGGRHERKDEKWEAWSQWKDDMRGLDKMIQTKEFELEKVDTMVVSKKNTAAEPSENLWRPR
ncbi:P-loop containing nucleoside triphosphate hydrolase protein [Lasiosphaeris hirsuta]|uniref:P-loop containing nucleoside triphosphate hydrolase protein n=1 Tax=Lasiosphaeris hirsuta TaxID=260670 RepID=A0AA40A9M3_9PEZI|nr:P-loop containing nucleoside triphosphate hydrolase protein [Lasiosphaeris hirsuta]